ncbi:MAG: hypothetical protein ACFCUV_22855, partial [Rivularia sp. (in: cyanobacteria)]
MKKPFEEVIKLSKICILSVATNLTFTSMDYTVKAIPATCGFQPIMKATGVKVYYINRQSSKK